MPMYVVNNLSWNKTCLKQQSTALPMYVVNNLSWNKTCLKQQSTAHSASEVTVCCFLLLFFNLRENKKNTAQQC